MIEQSAGHLVRWRLLETCKDGAWLTGSLANQAGVIAIVDRGNFAKFFESLKKVMFQGFDGRGAGKRNSSSAATVPLFAVDQNFPAVFSSNNLLNEFIQVPRAARDSIF